MTDDLHYQYGNGTIVTRAGNFSYFISEVALYVMRLTYLIPVQLRYDSPTAIFPWPDNVRFVSFRPYDTVLEYARTFPLHLIQNLHPIREAVRNADMVWIRLPGANAPLVYFTARLLGKPVCMFVVGDVDLVSKHNPRYRGVLRGMRQIGVTVDWALTQMMTRNALTFAYGRALAEKLRRGGARNVHVTFTSLVREADIHPPKRFPQLVPPFHLLYVGRLAPEKGVDVLIEAAALWAGPGRDVHLHIVGKGPMDRALRAQAQQVTSPHLTVTFHGYLPQGSPTLTDLYHNAHLFVLPSRSEGIPKVLLEAMAWGVPILATRVGGIPDIVQDGYNGVLVSSPTPALFVQALDQLFSSPERLEHIAEGGHEFVRDHTWERQILDILRVVQRAHPELDIMDEDGR